MVGHDATFDRASSDIDGWLHQWTRTWAQVACGAGLAIGLFLLWRRFDGGLHNPLDTKSLLVVAIALTAAVTCIRQFWSVVDGSSIGRRVLPALVLAAVGLAVSLPLTNGYALSAFWILLIFSEILSFFGSDELRGETARNDDRRAVESEEAAQATIVSEPVPQVVTSIQSPIEHSIQELNDESAIEPLSGGRAIESDSPEVDGQVIQKLLRTRDHSGQEVLYGELRADFAKGDRQSRLHVAFCPPLERAPEVFAEATSIDEQLGEVTVKVAQVLSLGTRIDVELSAPAAAAGAVQVEFYAAIES